MLIHSYIASTKLSNSTSMIFTVYDISKCKLCKQTPHVSPAISSKEQTTASSQQQVATCKQQTFHISMETAPSLTRQEASLSIFPTTPSTQQVAQSSARKSSCCSNQHAKRVAFLLWQKKSKRVCGSPVDLDCIGQQKQSTSKSVHWVDQLTIQEKEILSGGD